MENFAENDDYTRAMEIQNKVRVGLTVKQIGVARKNSCTIISHISYLLLLLLLFNIHVSASPLYYIACVDRGTQGRHSYPHAVSPRCIHGRHQHHDRAAHHGDGELC